MQIYQTHSRRVYAFAAIVFLELVFSSCGGGGSAVSTPAAVMTRSPVGLSLSANSVTATPGASASSPVTVSIVRPAGDTDSVTITVGALPTGVQAQITQPGTGNSGTLTFTASASAQAGSATLNIQAADSATSASVSFVLNIPVAAKVSASIDTGVGVNGVLHNFMATSFQPAEWDYQFFQTNATAKLQVLNALRSGHTRLQPISQGTPQKSDKSWDFSKLNAILEPVASVTDKSPELQLATAPPWMNDSSGHLLTSHFDDFADYAAKMVKYYNTHPGFTDTDGQHIHAIFTPITYWGVFNEPNYNGVSAADYVTLYNKVVPKMMAAGSEVPIKFVAVELGDNNDATHRTYFTQFAANVNPSLPVDVVATHYYATCNQKDTDLTLFNQITNNFVPELQFIYQTIRTSPNPALAAAPVWVTENNVNADFSNNGVSACNPGQPFVTDQRGTNAYFAAWRTYVFSRLGQAGAQSIYHWDYDADAQYGEVDFNTGNTYLSYWLDYYLARYYPSCTGSEWFGCPGQSILATSTSEPANTQTVEVLSTKNADGSVVIMVANHAVNASSDNNGTGASRTTQIDVSALGTFAFADQLTIDAGTNATTGPVATAIAPSSNITVTLAGYGASFVTLSNSAISHQVREQSGTLNASMTSLVSLSPLTISADSKSLTIGDSVTVTWSAPDGATCNAGGDWSGPKDSSGSETLTPSNSGSYHYALTCGSASGSVDVVVRQP